MPRGHEYDPIYYKAFKKRVFYHLENFNRGQKNSLRADEIKLWLTPSAKQRRNPCSGLPAVYPDLSTRHDWPVKKALFCLS